jgi:ribosome-binding factor A
MVNRRHERVRELLKRELSTLLLREFSTAEAGFLSVNDVAVSGDLHAAVVYVGVVGSDDQRKRALALLQEHRVRLQGLVGSAVVLRYTPQLRFELDDSVARGNRVLQILDELDRAVPPGAEPSA